MTAELLLQALLAICLSADVPCYNKDTGTWMTLSEAHAYASVSNLYVKDGTVRVIEVSHK